MQNHFKNISKLLFRFSTQQSKPRKKFISISKMLKQETQIKGLKQPQKELSSSKNIKNHPLSGEGNHLLQESQLIQKMLASLQQNPSEPTQSGFSHMSPQEQQINHKIKSAIRSETIYYECTKKKHKLEPRHYALMFSKVLELRKHNHKERKQTEAFVNFLKIIEQNVERMPPQELLRIIFSMKKSFLNKSELTLFKPIIEKVLLQFSNSQNTEYDPKSYETFRLSTSIKLFKSLFYLLEATGSHFEQKIKEIMNELLNYILLESMKNKNFSRTGEYFPIKLKMDFLRICLRINASSAYIKTLMNSVLINKEKAGLETILDLEEALFSTPDLLERTRNHLLVSNQTKIRGNILLKIQKLIQKQIPDALVRSNQYDLLTKKLVKHLSYLSELNFYELKAMGMSSQKDEQTFRVLHLFHEAYKNYLIESFMSTTDKQQTSKFFSHSQFQEHSLYYLLKFFSLKMKNQGQNSLMPSIKKELKDLVGLLTKFYGKLSFLTQSIVIQFYIISEFSYIKHTMIQFLQVNTLSKDSNIRRNNFMKKDKQISANRFFQMIQYESNFRERCPVQYEVFIKSNFKNVLKYIFKSTNHTNTEKYAYFFAFYCRPFNQKELKSFVDEVVTIYKRQSWRNRAFRRDQVEVIYQNPQYFSSSGTLKESKEEKDQTNIFGQDISQKEAFEALENEKFVAKLQKDKEYFREFYVIDQKIRLKLRRLMKSFKLVILLLENIKIKISKQVYQEVINENLYKELLQSFRNELECVKFEKLLTKQNWDELIEIQEFLKDIWQKASPSVEVRNQSLIHKHELSKELQEKRDKKREYQSLEQKASSPKNEQNEDFLEQQEEESDDNEYTEEIEYLKGKDLIESETLKNYKQKQSKSNTFLAFKNKESLEQIKKFTNDFNQLPRDSGKLQLPEILLKKLYAHYNSNESESNEKMKVIDLASVDNDKIEHQNLNQIYSIQIKTNEEKNLQILQIFTKEYPTLENISELKRLSESSVKIEEIMQKVYFIRSKRLRLNQKKMDESNQEVIQQQGKNGNQNTQNEGNQNLLVASKQDLNKEHI